MINKLKVSLTKYGVREIIPLLREDKLKDFLNGTYDPGRTIDMPQFKSALGLYNGALPIYWEDIRSYPEQLGAFCLVAVIFSHEILIDVFRQSGNESRKGVIRRETLDDKVFTNLRGLMVDSGVSLPAAMNSNDVPYDFSNLLSSGEVGFLVKQLLMDRLVFIGWSEATIQISEFYRGFFEQCAFYRFNEVFNITIEQLTSWMEGQAIMPNAEEADSPLRNGWEGEEIEFDPHLAVSLATKPFLIITGSSGTGKTYGIRRFAAAVNPSANPEFNMTFIAVEAGWKDGRYLIGHRNPFGTNGEVYQPTALINMLLKASSAAFRQIPFFVLFDEMNLSHVEMYFAKFLALMETARHRGLHSQPLLTVADLELLLKYYKHSHEFTTYILEAQSNSGLYIPPNVFFIGTVNIDETTYMFSPKVLDRAFVIEKNTSSPSTLRTGTSAIYGRMTKESMHRFLLGEEFDPFRQNLDGQEGFEAISMNGESIVIPTDVLDFLESIYLLLQNFPFGYRTVIECAEYALKARQLYEDTHRSIPWLVDQNSLFDEILLQKVLPKLHGNRKQLGKTLKDIENICMQDEQTLFPKTLSKILAMEHNLMTLGYCGFVC